MSGTLALTGLPPAELEALGRRHRWSLSKDELLAVQAHFRKERREPTLVELETIAQTWSEHCKHKTFTSPIRFDDGGKERRIGSLLKDTIAAATERVAAPWCLSVFKDNAGIVGLDKEWALAFKVETHNHPSAVEPYGGAATGAGGVIRDVLGAGLGAKPILNLDVFCVAPDARRTLKGVVAGVRDYGNRMGIPTAAGAVVFHEGYGSNPLVFCGTLGLLPVSKIRKSARPGDLVVAAGGRTGRDGLKGATFSSAALDHETDASAVQIGHPIMEKRLLDALLRARDLRLYRAVTDCGAGGFSSAVGEMAAETGAEVELEKAPLKHQGLSPWEVWLSESQERMVFAVAPAKLAEFRAVFEAEGVETAVLGRFTKDRRLTVRSGGRTVARLSMAFLHEGLPKRERRAAWSAPAPAAAPASNATARERLLGLLGDLNVASKAWIVRQYDHEVQGQTVVKPFTAAGGPQDGCVVWPVSATCSMRSRRGAAVACGGPRPDLAADPRVMALACVDEALRNVVAAGGDPGRAALLDNFCWGDPEDPEELGALVRCAEGLRDAAVAFKAPFISGKDSLNNTFVGLDGKKHSIPGTVLVSAVAVVPDVRRTPGSDLKAAGRKVFLAGPLLGGPAPDLALAPKVLRAMHKAIRAGAAASVHDLSEGGLGVAAAEAAFGGGIGLELDLAAFPAGSDHGLLFDEAATCFLVEAAPAGERALKAAFKGLPLVELGRTAGHDRLVVRGRDGAVLIDDTLAALKAVWDRALPAAMEPKAAKPGQEAVLA